MAMAISSHELGGLCRAGPVACVFRKRLPHTFRSLAHYLSTAVPLCFLAGIVASKGKSEPKLPIAIHLRVSQIKMGAAQNGEFAFNVSIRKKQPERLFC